MTPDTRTPRGELPPDDVRLAVAELIRIYGPRRLARRLHMSRDALLTVAIGARALPGTLALLRERLPLMEGER